MALVAFKEARFRAARLRTIKQANEIIRAYQAQGYKLTLRQLYYQFVSRDLIPNSQREYKNLGATINEARLAGMIDWDAIEDRTRNVAFQSAWSGPQGMIDAAARSYAENPWLDQEVYIEVWVEKEALVGVYEPICDELRLPLLACRGNLSQSEMYEAGRRFARKRVEGKRCILLHNGDLDPSGWDMTRDNRDRIAMFARSNSIEVRRLALNMDQVDEYGPPPNPAKETDSRFEEFRAQFGDESWELDALEPSVLTSLIREAVEDELDHDAWEASLRREEENKEALELVRDNFEDVREWLATREED